MTSIRVICRLRPLNKKEIGLGGETCVNFNDKNIKVLFFLKKKLILIDRLLQQIKNMILVLIVFLVQIVYKKKYLNMQLNQLLKVKYSYYYKKKIVKG